MNTLKKILRFLLPIVVLAVALGITVTLINNRPKPKKNAAAEQVTPVDIVSVAQFDDAITVDVSGTVTPAEMVQLRPQVAGRIVEMSDQLVPGGFFNKGDLILKIEARDYEIAVNQRKADLERARFELTNEQGLAAIAQKEWELLGDQVKATPEGRELSLRKPQLRRAQASLEAAEKAVELAELNLARTEIRAPFNALVQSEMVDLGQLINAQSNIAVLTGTDSYWIQASVPLDQLGNIQLPDRDGKGGAEAGIVHRGGQGEIQKEGRVVRLLGDLGPSGRMARLLIEVDDPLGLNAEEAGLPLLQNAFVQVQISGKPMSARQIPAIALREGNKVWVMNQEERLEQRDVSVLWQEADTVLLGDQVRVGERIITSRIPAPIPGMKLRVAEGNGSAPSGSGNGGQ